MIELTPSDRKIAMICLLLAAVVFAFDLLTPLGVAAGMPYVFVVAITVWAEKPKLEFAMAVLSTALVVAGFFLSKEGGIMWMALMNRALAFMLIWLSAWLIYGRRRYILDINTSNTELEELQNSLKVQVAQRTYELSTSEALLRNVLDSTDMGFLVISPLGDIKMTNNAADLMFGCDKHALEGWNIKSMFKYGQDEQLHYLLSARDRAQPRVVHDLEANDDKGNLMLLTVKSVPTYGRAEDQLLFSVTQSDKKAA